MIEAELRLEIAHEIRDVETQEAVDDMPVRRAGERLRQPDQRGAEREDALRDGIGIPEIAEDRPLAEMCLAPKAFDHPGGEGEPLFGRRGDRGAHIPQERQIGTPQLISPAVIVDPPVDLRDAAEIMAAIEKGEAAVKALRHV